MIVALASALAAQTAAAPPAGTTEEVVVIRRKLNDWRARFQVKDGRTRCVISRSTGDKDIDAIGCRVTETCVTRMRPQLQASTDRKLSRTARKAATAQVERQLVACMTEERTRLIEDLAERRYQASR